MKRLLLSTFAGAVLLATASAQTLDQAAASARADLEKALQELAAVREQVRTERLPLARELNRLEDEVIAKRREAERLQRQRDLRTVDLNALRNEVKQREDEVNYLSNLLSEYGRAFESRIHISEKQIYGPRIREAQLAVENVNLSRAEKFQAQIGLLRTAIERLKNVTGGQAFEGNALVGAGVLKKGRFAQIGPVVVFASTESEDTGLAEMRPNTDEPFIIDIGRQFAAPIRELALNARGLMPFDPTLGDAIKIALTRETLWEHIKTGGPVMVPILGLAFAALMVAIFKFIELNSVKIATPADLRKVLEHVNSGNTDDALKHASSIKGPFGELLTAAVKHSDDNKELIEEVLYERMLHTQPKLEKMLPFIALTAGSAPLLGLLGTVTGMINTFKLITVFGTGDARSLSSGISEALTTTEFGLYVAIPSLLLHAVLNRKAKSIIGQMEQMSVGFINGLRNKG
jgi:biopolymer transport protein ExbB